MDKWTSHVQGCVAVHFWATPQTFLSDHLHMYVCDFLMDHKLLQTAHISICVKLTQSSCRLREKKEFSMEGSATTKPEVATSGRELDSWVFFVCVCVYDLFLFCFLSPRANLSRGVL